eukprot:985219-Prymnesium_polylepis.1
MRLASRRLAGPPARAAPAVRATQVHLGCRSHSTHACLACRTMMGNSPARLCRVTRSGLTS